MPSAKYEREMGLLARKDGVSATCEGYFHVPDDEPALTFRAAD